MSASGSQRLYPPMAPASASPLPGQADVLERARPLRHWTSAQKDAVRSRFAAVHGAWGADWLSARSDAEREPMIQLDEEGPRLPDDAVRWSYAPGPAAAPRRTAHHAIAGELFGVDLTTLGSQREPPAVATTVVQAAWKDWLQRLQALFAPLHLEPLEPLDDAEASLAGNRWSGSLHLRWPWCGGFWHLALSHGTVAALLGEAATKPSVPARRDDGTPKVRLDQALRGHRLTLRATLGDIELELGQLQGLHAGDIVPLAHPLDAPVRLVGTDGATVCEGWLGQLDGRMAVELSLPAAAAPAPSAPTHLAKKGTP